MYFCLHLKSTPASSQISTIIHHTSTVLEPSIGDIVSSSITTNDDDVLPYVLLGPGARLGLELIFGPYCEKKNISRTEEQIKQVQYLLRVQCQVYDALGVQFDYWNGQSVSAKVIEYVLRHCHC